LEAFENLRCHALEKLEAKERFTKLGEATLKARIVGSQNKITVHVRLKSTGAELKNK